MVENSIETAQEEGEMIFHKAKWAFCLAICVCLNPAFHAQEAQKLLKLEDYPRWKHLSSPAISPDGKWMSYILRPNGGDGTLVIRSLSNSKIFEKLNAQQTAFAGDSQWAAYMIAPITFFERRTNWISSLE